MTAATVKPNIQSALICDRNSEESIPQSQKNCASAGVQLFQVFSSTSALLGLSRNADYSALNANLNALINWRRGQGVTGQSNMWGEIKGTGLAGGGTGAAGSHGAGENIAVPQPQQRPLARPGKGKPDDGPGADDFLAEFNQRDPATADVVVSHREACAPLDIEHKPNLAAAAGSGNGFTQVQGLRVSVRTGDSTDKVLVVGNVPVTLPGHGDGAAWCLKRGGYTLGPAFHTWTGEPGRLEHVMLPWVDEPRRANMDLDYSLHCRLHAPVKVCDGGANRRQLTAVRLPGGQVTTSRGHERVQVRGGRWHDVPGLEQVSVCGEGEKVLVIATARYTALWSDPLTRGRFTIVRNGKPLDHAQYGLQSVRALRKGAARTVALALVDDPEPGPLLYAVKGVVTTEEDAGGADGQSCSLEDDRQLSLVRLPAALVSGPARCDGSTSVVEDRWTEVLGLTVTARVASPSDKVLLVYNVNAAPQELDYEVYFTVFRTGASGSPKNLGSEEQGLWSLASTAVASSEYPNAMFTDAPGAGNFTYTVQARTRRCGSSAEPTAVDVGPDGQIAAIALPSGASAAPQAREDNLANLLSAELDAAGHN